jgi:hypothetical protein
MKLRGNPRVNDEMTLKKIYNYKNKMNGLKREIQNEII